MKPNSAYSIPFLIFILLITACNSLQRSGNESLVYQHAIENSMYPTAKKVCCKLVDIQSSNTNLIRKTIDQTEHILMLTWKAKNYYPESGKYNTGSYEIWVTAAPELYQKMKGVKAAKQALRLRQLLGLPPDAQNKIFIEFWVKPADLFRPCPDKEIDDKCCNFCFSKNDSLDSDYIKWINTGRIDRYYASGLYNQYPWTQLGYTYDWHPKNKSHIGVSEFVIKKNSTIYVNKAYTTAEYLTVRK
ncbi:MAG: hypothetical protein IT257_00935 [Chitinophagaceae bacterium]|nr:hypothetical protein [Chitinophagaceae bacterium]